MNLRSYRIFGIALFDLVASLILFTLLFVYIHKKQFPDLNQATFIIAGLLLTIPFGIIAHVLFGVNTTLNYNIGLSNKPTI